MIDRMDSVRRATAFDPVVSFFADRENDFRTFGVCAPNVNQN